MPTEPTRRGGQACIDGKPAPVASCRGLVTRLTNVKYALSVAVLTVYHKHSRIGNVYGSIQLLVEWTCTGLGRRHIVQRPVSWLRSRKCSTLYCSYRVSRA